jgi:hypothetical protein
MSTPDPRAHRAGVAVDPEMQLPIPSLILERPVRSPAHADNTWGLLWQFTLRVPALIKSEHSGSQQQLRR